MGWQEKETNKEQLMKQNVSKHQPVIACDDSEIRICTLLVGITES